MFQLSETTGLSHNVIGHTWYKSDLNDTTGHYDTFNNIEGLKRHGDGRKDFYVITTEHCDCTIHIIHHSVGYNDDRICHNDSTMTYPDKSTAKTLTAQ